LSDVIRRSPLRLPFAVAAATVALSGCATFTNTEVAAQVGEGEITIDEFELLTTEYFDHPDVFGTTPTDNGRGDGDQSRLMLTVMVRQALTNQFFDDYDIDATQLRQEFKASVLATSPIGSMSDAMQTLIADIDDGSRTQLLTGVAPPSAEALQAMYDDDPASTGMMCMRHILVATEDEANQVLADLNDGADFATLAAERSIEPGAAETGGALGTAQNDCIPVQNALQNFDPGFTAGALEARAGVASPPVESSFGWHVILHRPWDEVAQSVIALHRPGDSGGYLYDGFMVTTGVDVSPRLGTWNPGSVSVLPIG
jgi:hypothetical protein